MKHQGYSLIRCESAQATRAQQVVTNTKLQHFLQTKQVITTWYRIQKLKLLKPLKNLNLKRSRVTNCLRS